MKPRWFQLLEEQRYGKGLTPWGGASGQRLGLTVTFLIGALRQPPGGEPTSIPPTTELHDLLVEMMTAGSDSTAVRIYECGNLHQPTACLSDIHSASLGDPVIFADGSPSCLYAWPQYFGGDARDLKSLSTHLYELLGGQLGGRRLSHRLGSYLEFDQDDRDFIARAFLRGDDEG